MTTDKSSASAITSQREIMKRFGLRNSIKRVLPRWVITRRLARHRVPIVLLTFDDGPHPDVTPRVLDRLDMHGAKAIFFVVGRRIRHAPNLLSEIVCRGHLIGNHTHLHRTADVRASKSRSGLLTYYRDVRRCQKRIERQLGWRPTLFRPPGGTLSPVTVTVSMLLGLRLINWSVDVGDWRFRSASEARHGAEQLLDQVTAGDIVLLHDDNTCVLDLLDIALPGLRDRGYDLSLAVDSMR